MLKAVTRTYVGSLCKRKHDDGSGGSLRYDGSGACVACIQETNEAYRASGKSLERGRERLKDHFYRYYLGARRNGPKRGHECTITPDFLRDLWNRQGGRCYWLGIPLDLTNTRRRGNHPAKATLERLDGAKGYVPGNVVWASSFANQGRGVATVEEFATFLGGIGLRAHTRALISA